MDNVIDVTYTVRNGGAMESRIEVRTWDYERRRYETDNTYDDTPDGLETARIDAMLAGLARGRKRPRVVRVYGNGMEETELN